MNLSSKIESLLFVSSKPLGLKKLAELCQTKESAVAEAIKILSERYKKDGSGLQIIIAKNSAALSTAPASAKLVQEYLKDEMTDELTRPSLETLTIIAYRGPISKLELEQIRGVNCSLILRNLLMRGLIDVESPPAGGGAVGQYQYSLSFDFLRFLGVSSVEDLPDYEKLNSPQLLEKFSAEIATP